MKKLLFAAAAVLTVILTDTAGAADLPMKAEPIVARFSWTGCYLGGTLGGAFARKDITDPVQLVQDSFSGPGSTTGITTVRVSPNGAIVGGQIGCDYQFANNAVIGIEGFAGGLSNKSSTAFALPLGGPGDFAAAQATTDFLTSITGRLGYAFDRVLLYGRGGFALAGDKYEVLGSFNATPFNFTGLENRIGWTAGAGVEWAFSPHWSVNLEYDYYGFGTKTVTMFDAGNQLLGFVDVKQNIQVVKVGLNFHAWGLGW
jgi:opacity protein-like surface antigen